MRHQKFLFETSKTCIFITGIYFVYIICNLFDYPVLYYESSES